MNVPKPRPLVAGNWKMNGLKGSATILREIMQAHGPELGARADLLVCPPATLLSGCAEMASGSTIAIGGQDCHPEASGARTGDISAEMLADAGAAYVIVGHSERRADHGETDALVRPKAKAAWRAGLTAIICVGETREEREAGRALDTVSGQLRGSVPDGATAETTVIAYEPVWAIGTGLTPTPADVAEMHARIRSDLASRSVRSRPRGSVSSMAAPSSRRMPRELLSVANVDGALVGGASLVAADFLAIARAYLPN
jgi:triosephosphate isomerase